MRDRAGCVWWGYSGATEYNCGSGFHVAPFWGAQTEPGMHEGPDGRMTVWGFNLLALGRPGAFHAITTANGLAGPEEAIFAQDGTVWLGNAQGLYRFASPFRIEFWTVHEGVTGAPWSFARSGGRIFAGLDRRIISLGDDRLRWETFATFKYGSSVSSLLGTGDGHLLAGFIANGAVELSRDGKVVGRTGPAQFHSPGMRLTHTTDGEIWIGGSLLGQLQRRGSTLVFQNHPLETQPSPNILAVKYEERTRKLWACYSGGVVVRDPNGNWREITQREGLLTNGCWSLAPLPNGDAWYSYYRLPAIGLIRLGTDGRVAVRQYGLGSGIPEPANDTMDADRRGWLWRGGEQGIYVADPAEAEAGQWLQLDQADGFPANDMNTGSVFVDNDGSLWWGADNDLVHYSPPPDLVHPKFAPQVFVSAFSSDNNPPRLAEAVAALPHGSKITAHIGSLQFDRRNALRLRYRLLPGQSAWRETRSLDLPLGSLSSGSHTLEVQGRVFTGPWSTTVIRSFTVLPPAWLAWPFVTAYLVSGAGLATGGYVLHRRWLAEKDTLLPDLAAWRLGALLPEVHQLSGMLLDRRFETGDLLARGGFANVFSGYDREQQQRCAIKVFRGEIKDRDWIRRRFQQEVAALQRVRHPHVVPIYAHGSTPSGAPYLVMEYVEGRNLREVLDDGPLPPRRIARLLGQLAGALDAIHALGICHRDVKPENVIIRREGARNEDAVLIDFSIAIVKDADETLHGLSRAAGSFDYMAPEQAVGYAESSSDIYSLAKLTIEMLTGERLKDLLPDAALDLPERVRELLRARYAILSAESIHMLAIALEFDPAKRPRAAGAFASPIVNDLARQPENVAR
ncbi:MAG TPA: serine/threonine-protein kinase [Bryobacteraceae bacterium]|nr:serine/threonine-protein kinase [Bryobacteraceae bacterium]